MLSLRPNFCLLGGLPAGDIYIPSFFYASCMSLSSYAYQRIIIIVIIIIIIIRELALVVCGSVCAVLRFCFADVALFHRVLTTGS
jgi:hypothetical protein